MGGAERKEEKGAFPQWKLWRDDTGDLFDDLHNENKRINENSRISVWMTGGMGSSSSVWGIKRPSGEIQQAFSYTNLKLR